MLPQVTEWKKKDEGYLRFTARLHIGCTLKSFLDIHIGPEIKI